jgi:hypothetical protein
MNPKFIMILYSACFLLFPVGFTTFLTFYDLTDLVRSNALALINIAKAGMTSETEIPIIGELVVYYLNYISRYVMWVAIFSAVAFKIFIQFQSRSYCIGFPRKVRQLRQIGIIWICVSAAIAAVVAIALMYPMAQRLLLAGKIVNTFVEPAYIAALTGAFGFFGSALSWGVTATLAIFKILDYFMLEALLTAVGILLLVFLGNYYCASLALSWVVLPRISAPLSNDNLGLGWLRNWMLGLVNFFLSHGLDALKGPDAAAIISDVIRGTSSDPVTN